jgi:regulatory protein
VRQPKPTSLRARALRLLASREHTRAELGRKLLAFSERPEELDALLDDLARRSLLSDQRAAEQVVHTRQAKFGARRIAYDLRQRGVAADIAAPLLRTLRDTELAHARAVWMKRFRGERPADLATRAKQMRFLSGRGFSAETIRRLLGEDDSIPGE